MKSHSSSNILHVAYKTKFNKSYSKGLFTELNDSERESDSAINLATSIFNVAIHLSSGAVNIKKKLDVAFDVRFRSV